jgi:putative nucleotidyltransferase with HDIG domain
MQRFKPLLAFNHATVIENSIDNFRHAGFDQITVVIGHNAGELQPFVERLGVRCVVNSHYDQGMYSSLTTGFGSLSPWVEACFLLPADMPLVRSHTIRLIERSYRRTKAPVVYPVFRGRRGHPPLISSRLFPAILSGDGVGGLRSLLSNYEHDACEVKVLDEGILLDLDTPADYLNAQRLGQTRYIPTVLECEAILNEEQVLPQVVNHSRMVSKVAGKLATRLNQAGLRLDIPLATAAGLLHDVAKGVPEHACVGSRVLKRLGFPQVARIIALHTELDVAEPPILDEAAVVYLADKLVQGVRVVSITTRFEHAFAKLRDDSSIEPIVMRRWRTTQAIASAAEQLLGMGLLEFASSDFDPGIMSM